MMSLVVLVVLCVLALCACAHRDIIGKVSLGDGSPVSNALVSLNAGKHRAITNVNGSFVIYEVPIGVFVCDVHSNAYHFPQLKMKVETENVTVAEYKFPGAPRLTSSYPLSFVALSTVQYEVAKPPFSILGFIMQNPMMLLMLFSFVMMAAMPKLMANMSPEELAEMQKQTAANGDPMKNISKLMGMPTRNEDDEDE